MEKGFMWSSARRDAPGRGCGLVGKNLHRLMMTARMSGRNAPRKSQINLGGRSISPRGERGAARPNMAKV